jgi:hypothetical protein
MGVGVVRGHGEGEGVQREHGRLLCEKSQAIGVGRSGPLSENKRQPARPDHQEMITDP